MSYFFIVDIDVCTFSAFTFARPIMLSPVRLSSVCNVRAPYSAGWNFRQYFYAICCLGHPLTSTENFYGDRPTGTRPSGQGLNARAILDLSKAISWKQYKIGGKSVLITNRQSYMSFRLVPKSVTLNDLERRNGPYFALFHRIRVRCRRKKTLRSLSHLLMSFLSSVVDM